jgi:hypothetical protein
MVDQACRLRRDGGLVDGIVPINMLLYHGGTAPALMSRNRADIRMGAKAAAPPIDPLAVGRIERPGIAIR